MLKDEDEQEQETSKCGWWPFIGMAIAVGCVRLFSEEKHDAHVQEIVVQNQVTPTPTATASAHIAPTPSPDWQCYISEVVVVPGLSNYIVQECQTLLQGLGFDLGSTGADGSYGPKTAKAWKQCHEKGMCGAPPRVSISSPLPYVGDVYSGIPSTTSSSVYATPITDVIFGGGNFIPYHGNGGGPTLLNDGTWSHSSGPGTGSHHGGVAGGHHR